MLMRPQKQWGKNKALYEMEKSKRAAQKPGPGSAQVPQAPKPSDKPKPAGLPKPPVNVQNGNAPVRKTAYLTFDDGPSANITPKVLDTLKEENVKATFFVIGKNAQNNPDILKRIIAEGHGIGNHTYDHNASAMYSSLDDFKQEVNKWQEPIKQILGDSFSTRLFRFPGGLFKKHAAEAAYIRTLNYKVYDWNCISFDAEHPEYTPDRLLENVKRTMGKKTTIIVLNHDSECMQNSLNALKSEIDYMKNQGYAFGKLK